MCEQISLGSKPGGLRTRTTMLLNQACSATSRCSNNTTVLLELYGGNADPSANAIHSCRHEPLAGLGANLKRTQIRAG